MAPPTEPAEELVNIVEVDEMAEEPPPPLQATLIHIAKMIVNKNFIDYTFWQTPVYAALVVGSPSTNSVFPPLTNAT